MAEEKEGEEKVTLSQQLLAVLDLLQEELLHGLGVLQIWELQEVTNFFFSRTDQRLEAPGGIVGKKCCG